MAKGISLHIGLNYVNPNHYTDKGKPWDGELLAAEADANAMFAIAQQQGFESYKLLREDATRIRVAQEIIKASDQLSAGDTFFLSYAGHGSQVPDITNDEGDGLDETWCLYDAQMVDDELLMLWSRFKAGVRVLIVSDSCHSGTVFRGGDAQGIAKADHITDVGIASRAALTNLTEEGVRYRFMPRAASFRTYEGNREFYDEIINNKNNSTPEIKATVRQLSACRDDQFAKDGRKNGFFTETLLKVWENGKFDGDYDQFYEKIHSKMTHWWTQFSRETKQEPWKEEFGIPDPGFNKPFVL